MRWKFLRVENRGTEEIAERFEGTAEEAMCRLIPLREQFTITIAVTDGEAVPCEAGENWRMMTVARLPDGGWTGRHPTAAEAIRYELQRGWSKPVCIQVINRAGKLTQVVLYAGTGKQRHYDGYG